MSEPLQSLYEYWQRYALRLLLSRQWDIVHNLYFIPDTRPRWKRWLTRLRWHTTGRFHRWLHRNCGDC